MKRPKLECGPKPTRIFVIFSSWALFLLALSQFTLSLRGATNLISSDEIPPLIPARPELPPTFWEQHGTWVVAGAGLLVVLFGGALWLLRRPRLPVAVPPAVQARQALEPLKGRAEDGLVLSSVSQILHHYVTAEFELPAGELTTTEFCGVLVRLDRMGPQLSAPLTEFLRECDRRKFAPGAAPLEPFGAVDQAFRFIEQCEARLAQVRQNPQTPVTEQTPTAPEALNVRQS